MTFSLRKAPAGSFNRLWSKFAKNKKFRDAYVAGYVKRAIPAQIRALMKKGGFTQQQLAERAGLTQGVISRAADLNYGDLTLNTILKIGAGLDCAFVGKYVAYSEFLKETDKGVISNIPSFESENEQLAAEESMDDKTSSDSQEPVLGSESKKPQSIGTLPPQPQRMGA